MHVVFIYFYSCYWLFIYFKISLYNYFISILIFMQGGVVLYKEFKTFLQAVHEGEEGEAEEGAWGAPPPFGFRQGFPV